MAEPPAVTPSVVAGAEQDVLLATKLHVPGPQPGFVARPRLVEALDEGLARGLILVCAPAGFGKTALLADWARLATGRWRGCRWTLVIMTRCGSGVTWSRRWTGSARGSPSGPAPCWARPRRRRL